MSENNNLIFHTTFEQNEFVKLLQHDLKLARSEIFILKTKLQERDSEIEKYLESKNKTVEQNHYRIE